jgi:hypothetical protein
MEATEAVGEGRRNLELGIGKFRNCETEKVDMKFNEK